MDTNGLNTTSAIVSVDGTLDWNNKSHGVDSLQDPLQMQVLTQPSFSTNLTNDALVAQFERELNTATNTELVTNQAWSMHPIASQYRVANGLGVADVNGDGFLDYVTNYEFDQRYVISLHPGASGDPRRPWSQVVAFVPKPLTVSTGVNPENATFGDFDGDGNLDIVGAQGWSDRAFWEGSQPGIRLLWGPGTTKVTNGSDWIDAGRIPATINMGHFHYVRSLDVNGDGLSDIVAGGRVHGGNGRKAGIIWMEAPSLPSARRDLSQWRVHAIAPNQFSGYGFEFADIDEDGDLDIRLVGK